MPPSCSARSLASMAVVALLVLGGCGGSAPVDVVTPPPTSTDSDGGFGPPAAAPGEFHVLPGTVMVGSAELAPNGCWYLAANGQSALLIAAAGTQLGRDGQSLLAPDGTVIGDGAAVDLTGGLVGLDDLPGGADGRWGNYVAFCEPASRFAAVAGTMQPTVDPSTTDVDALAAELDASVFDTDYGCGFGFTTGDTDGRWALRIEVTTDPPNPGPVSLPDPRFVATVTAGAHLFANHCDDVMEWFEPEPIFAVGWELTAGRFTYPATSGEICAGEPPATIVLTGARVETPAGPIELDPIEITNTAFGCFAG